MIYNLGRVVPLFKGNYDAATTYGFLDVVYYDNSSFVALDTTTGNLPTDTTHWLPVALKGTTQNPTPAQMQQIISEVETYMHSTDFVYDPDYTHIDVINNLTSTSTTNALSANQGKVLNETIDGVSHSVSDLNNTVSNLVIDSHTSTSTTNALSANQGKVLYDLIDDNSHSIFDLENDVDRLDGETLKGISINLYDKNRTDFIPDKYINTNGSLSTYSGSIVSPLIKIKPNTIYAYQRIGGSQSDNYFRFVAANGTTPLMPINPSTGEAFTNYSQTTPSRKLKSPSNAVYAQFTVKFGSHVGMADVVQIIELAEGEDLPTTYFPYKQELDYNQLPTQLTEELSAINTNLTDKIGRTEYESDLADIDAELDTKAEYTHVIGKNLIDPSKVQLNKFISYSTSGIGSTAPSNYNGAACSGLIPITAGNTYYLTRGFSQSDTVFAFIQQDGIHTLTPLDPTTHEPVSMAQYVNKSRAYEAPEGAYYALICLALSGWTDTETQIVGFQFEEGSVATPYEPYWEKDIINYEHLPNEVEDTIEETVPDLIERVEALEGNSSFDTINVANSEKIGFFSNSFLNGYCMKNHHAINNLSMFSDYIMYNYGHSGDDILELLARIDANSTWLGAVPVRDWGIKYGIIAMQDNDGALYAANSETYYENTKKMCEAIKSMGGIPVLSTEHDWNKYYYAYNRLSDEEGYMFMDWGKKANIFCQNRFTQFWLNGHPSTRTAWLWSDGMKPYFDTLPRPKKSIKMFRVRNSSDLSNIQNLVYNTYMDRAERFIELDCGTALIPTASDKYFDRLNLGYFSFTSNNDEYQKIQNNTSVSFGNGALIEVITPYDRNNLNYFKVDFTSTGTISHAYCKKINGLVNPLPSRRYYSFGIVEGANLLNVGDSITISGITRADGVDLNRTFTIGGIVNDMLITTTTSSPSQGWTNGKTSGTDEPTCNISGVVLHGSYDYPDAAYMERYNKPLGEWTEVVISNGSIELTQQQIKDFTNFDKVAILLVGTDIAISDVQATVAGSVVKNNTSKRLIEKKLGTSLLTNTTFTSSDTSWIGIGDLADYTPITDVNDLHPEVLPMGFTNVKIMEEGDSVVQQFTTSGLNDDVLKPTKLQLQLVARYFPKYVKTDEDWATSDITESSLDIAKVKVYVMTSSTQSNPTVVAEIPVGAWWDEKLVDFEYYDGSYIKLECTSKSIHVGKCNLIKLNN